MLADLDPTVPVVIDAGIGNVGSVVNMARRTGTPVVVSGDPDVIAGARTLVFPGVGHWDSAVAHLRETGIDRAMLAAVDGGASLLGICLGMQLLLGSSEEGQLPGLGLVDGRVKRFDHVHDAGAPALKVPHMGWNLVGVTKQDVLTDSLGDEPRFYFVHSYHLAEVPESEQLLTCHYGYDFVCGVRLGNVWGVQFHPEKSHRFGMQLLSNYFSAAVPC